MDKLSRKHFLRSSAFGLAGLTMLPTGSRASTKHQKELSAQNWKKKFSANDRIRVAALGMGIIAHFNVRTALEIPGAEFVAAADSYDSRLTRTKEVYGNDVFTTRDYREILNRPDIDLVLINTPDHWHAKMAVDALEAGKHVFCEKPMVQKVEEGKKVIEAHRKSGKVLQVGSQFGSDIIFLKAAEMVKAGDIGQLNQVVATYNRNSSLGAWQYSIPDEANPENVDWDGFLGHAPRREWTPSRFFRWRNYDDYGTGVPGDLFVHLFSGIHTVVDSNGPDLISGFGGLRSWNDGRDAEDVVCGQYHYPETENHPEFTCVLQSNLADGGSSGTQFMFIGDEGSIQVRPGNSLSLTRVQRSEPTVDQLVRGYNSISTFSEADQRAFERRLQAMQEQRVEARPEMNQNEDFRAPRGYDSRLDHFVNLFDSIRNGAPEAQGPEFGLRAAAPSLLTTTSMREQKVIRWDPDEMRVMG